MRIWLLATLALFAVYFPIATWLKASYVDPTPKGRVVVMLPRPFERFGAAGAISRVTLDGEDTNEVSRQSQVLLYEDGKLLGPAHNVHSEIAELGHGRYSHWEGVGIIFSASDNSDPNTNSRYYWAVIPEPTP
jgi:hypothetical protein